MFLKFPIQFPHADLLVQEKSMQLGVKRSEVRDGNSLLFSRKSKDRLCFGRSLAEKINLSRVKYSYFGCLQEQALTYALSPAFKCGHYITAFELLQCNVLSVVSNRNKKN